MNATTWTDAMASRKHPVHGPRQQQRPPRVLAAVVALSMAAWVVIVSEGSHDLDPGAAQSSLAALDAWLGSADTAGRGVDMTLFADASLWLVLGSMAGTAGMLGFILERPAAGDLDGDDA